MSGQTSTSTTSKNLRSITFPSLTICRTMKNDTDWRRQVLAQSHPATHNKSFDFLQFLDEISHSREEVMTFFTHAPRSGDVGLGKCGNCAWFINQVSWAALIPPKLKRDGAFIILFTSLNPSKNLSWVRFRVPPLFFSLLLQQLLDGPTVYI